MSENREYKSDTFSMLMEEPKYALAVYNVLNGTSYADELELEAIVTVYNINSGKNDSLLENCEPLRGYTYLVETVRRLLSEGIEKENAVPRAIDDCIKNHILEDFFRERRDEVERNMTIDMTWEAREKIIRRDEREEGRMEGFVSGQEEGQIQTLQWIEESMRKNGLSEEQIQTIIEDVRNQ